MTADLADYDLDRLAEFCQAQQRAGQRVVLCHGCFDLLHVGHVRYLQAARALGDVLVVTVTPDEFVNKGPGRPALVAAQRAELLAALRCVDAVGLNRWPTAVPTIERLKPAVYAKGAEYRESSRDASSPVGQERDAVETLGGVFQLIEGEKFSSTAILARTKDLP